MRELTKKQKIKILDVMIKKVINKLDGLCSVYGWAMRKLHYREPSDAIWTPRFKELDNKIGLEIKRTGGCAFIDYGSDSRGFDDKKWKSGRLNLLKKLKKQLENHND